VLQRMKEGLAAQGILSDVYFTVDLTTHPPKHSTRDSVWTVWRLAELKAMNSTPVEVLHDAINTVQPVSAISVVSSYCERNDCFCKRQLHNRSALLWPRLVDKMVKVSACYKQVKAHERANGWQYDWVFYMRTDLYLLDPAWSAPETVFSPAVVGNLLRRRWVKRPVLLWSYTKDNLKANAQAGRSPWQWPSVYGQSDFLSLVPREHADAYFNFVEEWNCDWHADMLRRYSSVSFQPFLPNKSNLAGYDPRLAHPAWASEFRFTDCTHTHTPAALVCAR